MDSKPKFKRDQGIDIPEVRGLPPEVQEKLDRVRRGEIPPSHLPLKQLPGSLVVTAGGKTVAEMIEERRAAAEKGRRRREENEAAAAVLESRGIELQSVRDEIREAYKRKGGVDWLMSLDDKELRQLVARVVEKDLDDDKQRVSHEEWLERLKALDAESAG